MKKHNPWKISTFVFGAGLALALAGISAPEAQAEPQPRMKIALKSLQKAKHNLARASHDKGGHRKAALILVDKAIVQVKKGIDVDNKH